MVDYLSKYPEILNIKDKTSHTVIDKMKTVFSRIGLPKDSVRLCSICKSLQLCIKLTWTSRKNSEKNMYWRKRYKQTQTHILPFSPWETHLTGMEYSPAHGQSPQKHSSELQHSSPACSALRCTLNSPKSASKTAAVLEQARWLSELRPGSTVHMEHKVGAQLWSPHREMNHSPMT